ncbi:MAG: OmpA family protein [Candidatus Aceula meridiana]|nr:OmpA family protein [Candidatus Aceula meridiana]
MRRITSIFAFICFAVILTVSLTGCTVVFQKGRTSDIQKISHLKREISDLERAKLELEDRLRGEINDKEVSIEMLEKGLVITFVSEVLFNSGKAKLRNDSFEKLDKIAGVLKTTVSDLNVGVEGHTDNVPIAKSGWKSNWELSSARAMSVLHYLVDEQSLRPDRLSATGYGEYQPVASNDVKEGRQKNRRVEIVILPNTIKKKTSVQGENLK